MGWFGKSAKRGRLLFWYEFPPSTDKSIVYYTLDPGETGRMWSALPADLFTDEVASKFAESRDVPRVIRMMNMRALVPIKLQIPSLKIDIFKLDFKAAPTDSRSAFEVNVSVPDATFREEEWLRVRSAGSLRS